MVGCWCMHMVGPAHGNPILYCTTPHHTGNPILYRTVPYCTALYHTGKPILLKSLRYKNAIFYCTVLHHSTILYW